MAELEGSAGSQVCVLTGMLVALLSRVSRTLYTHPMWVRPGREGPIFPRV